MSASPLPFSIVLRFPAVAISQAALEEALGLPLGRFGPARTGTLNYAQINISEDGDVWASLITILNCIGSAINDIVRAARIGCPWADVAIELSGGKLSTSIKVPSIVAKSLGQWNIDLEVSVYRTGPD